MGLEEKGGDIVHSAACLEDVVQSVVGLEERGGDIVNMQLV